MDHFPAIAAAAELVTNETPDDVYPSHWQTRAWLLRRFAAPCCRTVPGAYHIPVALLCVEFHGKAANIAFSVGRAALSRDGRKTREHGRLFADLREEFCLDVAANVMSNGESPVGARALGVHSPLLLPQDR